MKVLLSLLALVAISSFTSEASAYCRQVNIRCESKDQRPRNCVVANNYYGEAVRGGYLYRQISKATCQEGYSYRITREGVHVRNGCRGDFSLRVCQQNW